MNLDQIVAVLATLHDVSPETVRAIIQGAEKLRGLGLQLKPVEAAPPPAPAPASPESPPKVVLPPRSMKRNGLMSIIERYIYFATTPISALQVSVGMKIPYTKVRKAIDRLYASGRISRQSRGLYAAPDVAK